MFELLKVNTMCGVCCVSMKVVVFIDLIATMILPASYCYAMYLLFLVFFQDLPVSTILLILYAIIMGVQVVVFILRSRWDYLWWFFIYFTIGLPVFYLILPTYSFWNMDDFSWGKTRSVGGSAANNAAASADDDEDDEKRELYNRDDMSYASGSVMSGQSRGSRQSQMSRDSRRSNGSGGSRSYDRSYASQSRRSRDSRTYRSRDERSVGSGSRTELDSRINF
jgi:chitin synthase